MRSPPPPKPFGGHHETQVHVGGGNIGIERVAISEMPVAKNRPFSSAPGSAGNSGPNAPNTVETWTPTFSNTSAGHHRIPPPPPGSAPAIGAPAAIQTGRRGGEQSRRARPPAPRNGGEARRARPRRRRGSAFEGKTLQGVHPSPYLEPPKARHGGRATFDGWTGLTADAKHPTRNQRGSRVNRRQPKQPSLRGGFSHIATGAVGAVGAALALWPFIDQMNPDASVRALASIEVDLAPIAAGQAITVKWRGNPVFIRHRTPQEIEPRRCRWTTSPTPQRQSAGRRSSDDENRGGRQGEHAEERRVHPSRLRADRNGNGCDYMVVENNVNAGAGSACARLALRRRHGSGRGSARRTCTSRNTPISATPRSALMTGAG